ncbi:MAG: histidine phosphatase family protein [Candidatus Lokiarchaeota archaeon]|nr:histidine phosphatase family protein [Candidatus Lokiarchaeota archaeon]
MNFNWESLKNNNHPNILLLRHAERDYSSDPRDDFKCLLTEQGKKDAYSFGERLLKLNKKIDVIKTSPIKRCVQTAKAIINGAQSDCSIIYSKKLGDPGVFVSDEKIAFKTFLDIGILNLVQKLVNGENLPGLIEINEAVKHFLNEVISDLKEFSGIVLYISHDAIIGSIASYLSSIPLDSDNWITYLDGPSFYNHEENKIFMEWNRKNYEISHKVNLFL